MRKPNPTAETKWVYRAGLRINEALSRLNPKTCPVLEYTGDGVPVGACWHYMPDGCTCPTHGKIREEAQ